MTAALPRDHTTRLALLAQHGDASAAQALAPALYDTLCRIASGYLRRERSGHTFSTSDLVHEAYARMVDQTQADDKTRAHFIGISARVMRQVLVDYARRRNRDKRGGGIAPAALDGVATIADPGGTSLDVALSVDHALAKLEEHSPRLARVVECRFYGGLDNEETAQALGQSSRTVQRDWIKARGYLSVLLADDA
jgi:RNA polymerase sigma factor (TIGR02999 family)